MISGKNAIAVLLAAGLALTLAACGESETSETSASETEPAETVSASESAEPSDDESLEVPDGIWSAEDESEQVVIEDGRVTIERYIDEDNPEIYWVGTFEENDTGWTSYRDPDEEMTADCETIEFTWEGTDNVYDRLSYSVTNEDGSKTTVTLDRTLSAFDIYNGPGPAIVDEDEDTSDTSAADASSASAGSDTSSGDTAAVSSDASGSQASSASSNEAAADAASSEPVSGGTAVYSARAAENTGTASAGSADSSGSGSSSTAASACSHNYQSSVKTAATCSSTGTMVYTCTKCGDSYETTIPATGDHNWQTIYKTVHHDATGHYETVTVQEAVYEYRNVCNRCGYVAPTTGTAGVEDLGVHIRAEHPEGASYSNKKVCIQEAVTEQQWVVDTPAYDEQVADYQRCSVCGATT